MINSAMCEIKIKKLNSQATLPSRGTICSAGADLYACIESPVAIDPGEIKLIPTGIAIEPPAGSVVLIYGRSGLGVRYGITLSNSVGVIDQDYRGEILVSLINLGKSQYVINPNERIAQMVLSPVFYPNLVEVNDLSDSLRGDGRFGSTGL